MQVLFTSESGKPLIFNPDDRGVQTWTLFPKGGDHGEMLSRLPDRRWVLWRSVAPDRIGVDPMDEGRLIPPEEALRLLSRWHHELPSDLFESYSAGGWPEWIGGVDANDQSQTREFNVAGAESWSARGEESDWDNSEQHWLSWDVEELYRTRGEQFILQTTGFHAVVPFPTYETVKELTRDEAIAWFAYRDVRPPVDLEVEVVEFRLLPKGRLAPAADHEEGELLAGLLASDDESSDKHEAVADEATSDSGNSTGRSTEGCDSSSETILPRWDAEKWTLYYGDEVAKVFKRDPTLVSMVLSAFETAGWPERIDGALSKEDTEIARRHSHAVQSLNKAQNFIRFWADGTVGGVRWERRK